MNPRDMVVLVDHASPDPRVVRALAAAFTVCFPASPPVLLARHDRAGYEVGGLISALADLFAASREAGEDSGEGLGTLQECQVAELGMPPASAQVAASYSEPQATVCRFAGVCYPKRVALVQQGSYLKQPLVVDLACPVVQIAGMVG